MIRTAMLWLGAALLLAGAPIAAQTPADGPPRGDLTPPDYAKSANWLCHAGTDCAADLSAVVLNGTARSTIGFKADAKAPIDCFYVYPTASKDASLYSDMVPGPEETRAFTGQAARLASVCKVYAPMYHQLTATALGWVMSGHGQVDFKPPYADVLAAWRYYLAHDNKGRGVVLIGHSQGAILLKQLIAEEIDGKSDQKKLVGAYLAGNLDLTTKSFKAVPACSALGQTGCVVAWSSYLDGDPAKLPMFAAVREGSKPICVNPAALGGGRGAMKPFLPRPALAPESDPPFLEPLGQLTAECVEAGGGLSLRIRVEPGPFAELMTAGLQKAVVLPGWGLHVLDVALAQGNVIDDIAAQTTAWKAAH